MKKAADLHREAMSLADEAFVAKTKGESDRASSLLLRAFQKEREAASLLESDLTLEPTRSVLYRSAASLAIECEKPREAERLVAFALSGDPPDEIADELRDLLEQVQFHRHLELRGLALEPFELQLSLTGNVIGSNLALSDEFGQRVTNLRTALRRTAERKMEYPYREAGRSKLEKDFEVYVSTPRPGSFAISFRIGRTAQLSIPGMDVRRAVIDEVVECFNLFEQAQSEELKRRIPDPSYFRSFVGLARRIAPDGEKIQTVGFTTIREGEERRVVMKTPRDEIPSAVVTEPPETTPGKRVQVRGTLRFADARSEAKQVIRLVDEKGKSHKIEVRPGMMSDIVRPMWDYEVRVSGTKIRGGILLDTIDPIED